MFKQLIHRTLLVGFLSITALTGCNDEKPTENTTQVEQKKEVVVAIYRDGAMNMLDAASYNGPHFVFKMIYDGLTEDGGEGKIIPTLATSWDISKDGKTYTFKLRENVKFSDGTPFDADAVIFNLKRWVNNPRYSQITATLVDSMEAIDKHTVRITYKNPAYPILMEMTYPRPVRFLSPASLGEDGKTFTKPVGTGPWMLENYEKDKSFTLVPNPYYWGEKPKLDRIIFKVVPDGQARVFALQSGEVDIIGGDLIGKIPMGNIQELEQDKQFKTFTADTLSSHFIAFNQRTPELQDKRIRQAINYAIDKKSIAEDLFNHIGKEATGMYQSGVPYANAKNNYTLAGDKDKAQALLIEAGYSKNAQGIFEKEGKPLAFSFLLTTDEFPEWKTLAEFIQAELAQTGIQVNLKILDRNGYTQSTLESKDFDMALMRTASDSWMPHSSMLEIYDIQANNQQAKAWYDENLSAMIYKTLATLNEEDRQKGYDGIMTFISEEAITAPVYHPVTNFAINPKKVANFEVGVNNYAPVAWEKLTVPHSSEK